MFNITNIKSATLKKAMFIIPAVISTPSAYAVLLDGPKQSAEVSEGDPVESWDVRDGAQLTLNPGSATALLRAASGGKIVANEATINAVGRGIISIDKGDITISDSVVNATKNGTSSDYNSGVAFNSMGGRSTFTRTVLNSEGYGVTIIGERNPAEDYHSDMTFIASTINSGTGSGFLIGNSTPSFFISPTADIALNNGTVVNAGNGILLEVRNDVKVNLNISDSQVSGDIVASDESETNVQLNSGAILKGSTQGVDAMSVGQNAVWDLSSDSDVGELHNSGTVSFTERKSDHSLTVKGNYTGEGGLLILNSVLSDDNSETNRLIILGDSYGTSTVRINNLGGSGAKTLNGIEIISVAGQSDGSFAQDGRIVAGAYDYRLVRGQGGDEKNWYLSSELSSIDPGPEPEPSPEPEPGPEPEPTPSPETLRPEGSAYYSNMYSAENMFKLRRDDILASQKQTATSSETSRLWMSQKVSHTRNGDSSGQLRTRINMASTQIGLDLLSCESETGKVIAGVNAGFGRSSGKSTSTLTHYGAKSGVTGYSVGTYADWESASLKGLYANIWLQRAWFSNSVSGDELATEKYHSGGMQLSAETGYGILLSESERVSYYLQPSLQAIWTDIRQNAHIENNGTPVQITGSGNTQARVSLKSWAEINMSAEHDVRKHIRPMLELSVIRNTQDAGTILDGSETRLAGSKTLYQARTGLEGDLSETMSLSGYVSGTRGENRFSEIQGGAEFRIRF